MKKIIIVILATTLCFGMGACGGKEEPEKKGTTEQPTTTQAVDLSNPLGFDPHDPEGWIVEDWETWSDWMTDKGLPIAEKDYSVGDFTLGMSFKDAKKYFPSKPLSDVEKDNEFFIEKKVTFDSVILIFIKSDNDPPISLSAIEITGKEYVTPRGLKVGDSAEKLFELYGVPSSVTNGVWTFLREGGDYELFHATVVNGIVKKIRVNNILD